MDSVDFRSDFLPDKRKLLLLDEDDMISAAIITHAYYNSLIQSNFMIIGVIFPVVIYLPSLINLRRKMIKTKKNRLEQLLPDE